MKWAMAQTIDGSTSKKVIHSPQQQHWAALQSVSRTTTPTGCNCYDNKRKLRFCPRKHFCPSRVNKWHRAPDFGSRKLYRFSAFWLRSKCSICSYQLNIWYGSHVLPSILNWFLPGDEVQELAPALSRVDPVLQYRWDRPTSPIMSSEL